MIDDVLSQVAPHLCCGCAKIGALICDNCKYDIISDVFSRCIACSKLASRTGICMQCSVPYARAWCVGERSGVLQRLIDDFKFHNVSSAYIPLAEILIDRLDELPSNTIVVPVPTVAAHFRQRGYDHTLLLAAAVARARNLKMEQTITRATSTKQRDASRQVRVVQAKVAFRVDRSIDPTVPYLIVDDIVTTGATIQYAAAALQAADAEHIWVATIARQPLD